MLEEKISKHLGVKYIYLPDKKLFLCENGVLFSLEEYKNGIDLEQEYRRRKDEDQLYDYVYAKNTNYLRKKRGYKKTEEISENIKETSESSRGSDLSEDNYKQCSAEGTEDFSREFTETESNERSDTIRRNESVSDRQEEKQGLSVLFIVALLTFTSLISGYISTLHTATYLFDYVDVVSAWLMSASVTVYNATAFEVAVIFKTAKRYSLALLFVTLWGMVTLFSMATTVSVFYDMFNFSETQIAEENKTIDSGKLSLSLLQIKENDLREAIAFKKQDIEYRQDRDYATTAVRLELEALQKELQENLSEQQKILEKTPEVKAETAKRKESLFSFLGRLLHIEGEVFEFTMSTLSAIFVNLICPFSLIAVSELRKKKEE